MASEFEENSQDQYEYDSCSSYSNSPKRKPFSFEETPGGTIDSQDGKAREEKKEVTYTAFGFNLQNTIRLLSYSKKIDLIDKESDLKPKRMFVTS